MSAQPRFHVFLTLAFQKRFHAADLPAESARLARLRHVHRDQPSHGLAVPRNDHLITCRHVGQQAGKMCLRFVNIHCGRHAEEISLLCGLRQGMVSLGIDWDEKTETEVGVLANQDWSLDLIFKHDFKAITHRSGLAGLAFARKLLPINFTRQIVLLKF